MKEFDYYQLVGVIAPGMLVVLGGVVLFFPQHAKTLEAVAQLSIGGLGLGLILAYIVGQMLHVVGNGIEALWWAIWGGMPTDWVRSDKHSLVSPAQREQIHKRLKAMMHFSLAWKKIPARDWYAMVRQIYAAVASAGCAARAEVFNGNYGLCRGIAAGLLVLLVLHGVGPCRQWTVIGILLSVMGLALYRMHVFGVHYARELFVQFLNCSSGGRGKNKT